MSRRMKLRKNLVAPLTHLISYKLQPLYTVAEGRALGKMVFYNKTVQYAKSHPTHTGELNPVCSTKQLCVVLDRMLVQHFVADNHLHTLVERSNMAGSKFLV